MPLISKSFPFQHTPSLADLHLGEGSQLQPRYSKHAISNVHPGLPNPHAVGWDFISLTLPSWKKTVCGHRWFGMFDMIIDMDWNLGSQNHKTAQPFTLLKPSPSTSPSNASTPVPPLDRRLLRGENHTQAVKAGCHPGSFGEKILSFKRRKRRVIYLLEGDTRHRRLFCRTPWHWGLICQKKYINMPKKRNFIVFLLLLLERGWHKDLPFLKLLFVRSLSDREKMRGPFFLSRLQTNHLPSPHQKKKEDRIHSLPWTIGTREWFSLIFKVRVFCTLKQNVLSENDSHLLSQWRHRHPQAISPLCQQRLRELELPKSPATKLDDPWPI